MHIGRHIVQELVLEFGEPCVERWDVALTEPEFRGVTVEREHGRAHDVSLLVKNGEGVAVVREHGYPAGAYRIPLGGVHPEESFLDGASRETFEQTGLEVRVEDYLLQIHVSFTCGGQATPWTTHVMLARADGGSLAPRDTRRIESARWMELEELVSTVSPILVDSGSGELRYRAQVHERLLELAPA